MSRPAGQLERALVDLTIGMHQGVEARRKALISTKSGVYDQPVHLDIAGQANPAWGYADIPCTWEHPFVYSPLQWNVPFPTPHIAGEHFELTSVTPQLIVARAQVISWTRSPQGWFIGATVRVAVQAPGAIAPVPYSGVVHLTFQGFAYPTDEGLLT